MTTLTTYNEFLGPSYAGVSLCLAHIQPCYVDGLYYIKSPTDIFIPFLIDATTLKTTADSEGVPGFREEALDASRIEDTTACQ